MELTDRSCVRLITVFSKRFFVLRSPQFQPVILIDPRNLRVHYRRRLEMFCGPFRTQRMSQSHHSFAHFWGLSRWSILAPPALKMRQAQSLRPLTPASAVSDWFWRYQEKRSILIGLAANI